MFDYKKAWREEAAPRLLSLPVSSLQLIWRTHTEAKGLRQRRDLSLDWPNTDLKAAFLAMSDDELSYAAHVVSCAGHWHPGYKDWLKPLTKDGTYWRFATYANEILYLNLELKKPSSIHGFTLEVIEGALRVGYSFEHNWYSIFVGLATKENVKTSNAFYLESEIKNHLNDDNIQSFLQDLKKQVNDPRLINIKKYCNETIDARYNC